MVPPVTQFLGPKWLNYSSRCTEPKIESLWLKKLDQILVPPVTQLFKSKWLNFFSHALREKLSHFDIKSWVTWVELRQKHLNWKKKKTFVVLVTQSVTGSLVLLLKLLISKIHQNYCDINYILEWFWKWF